MSSLPAMQSTPVSGGAIVSDVMIIGQAPVRENRR
jgi:uracil-DNA glycosylase